MVSIAHKTHWVAAPLGWPSWVLLTLPVLASLSEPWHFVGWTFLFFPLRASLGMFSGSGRDTQGKAKLIHGSVSQSLLVSHLLALPWLKVIHMGPNRGKECGARAGRNCMAKALDLSRGKELEMGLQSTSQKQTRYMPKFCKSVYWRGGKGLWFVKNRAMHSKR